MVIHMQFLFILALDHALRNALNIREKEKGLKVTQKQTRRHSAVALTDSDFASNTAFISNTAHEAKPLLQRLKED